MDFDIPFHSRANINWPEITFLEQICAGKYFGAVVCDIRVPEGLKGHFAELLPVFKNVEMSIDDVGPYRKNLCQDLGEFKTPRRSLIDSYFRQQVMVASPLLQWHCAYGLVVENITAFICYELMAWLHKFTKEVEMTRQKADSDKAGTTVGNTAKLIGKLII